MFRAKWFWVLFLVLPLMGAQEACSGTPSADRVQERETREAMSEAQRQIGMPDIVNFLERRFARDILEMRDEEISTYTYIVDLNGNLHFVCESVGYGLPYSVQFTNPERTVNEPSGGDHTIPQPDPNGLFMPDGLAATWILCSDGEGGISPVYSEPELLVTTFPLNSSSNYQNLSE